MQRPVRRPGALLDAERAAALRIGALDSAAGFLASVPIFRLRLPGCRTCLAAKMHVVGPDRLHGHDERIITDVCPADSLRSPDWRPAGEVRLEWRHGPREALDAGTRWRSVNIGHDDQAEFGTTRWPHGRTDGGGGRPFALAVSSISPHGSPPGAAGIGGSAAVMPGSARRASPTSRSTNATRSAAATGS